MITFTQDQIETVRELTQENDHFAARIFIAYTMNDLQFSTIYQGLITAHEAFPEATAGYSIYLKERLEGPFTARMLNTITNSSSVKAAL